MSLHVQRGLGGGWPCAVFKVVSSELQYSLGITATTSLPSEEEMMEESRGGSWVAALQGQRPAGWRSGQVRKGEALRWGEGRGMRSQLAGTGTKRGDEQNLKNPWRQPFLWLQNSFLAWACGEQSVWEAPVPPWMIQVDSRSAWYACPEGLCREGHRRGPKPQLAPGGPEMGRNGPKAPQARLGQNSD